MKVKKIVIIMKCTQLVTPLRLNTTTSFSKISRTNTPQTGEVVHLTMAPGTGKLLMYCDPLFSRSAESWRPKKFKKHNHPLNLIVSRAYSYILEFFVTIDLMMQFLLTLTERYTALVV